MTLQYSSSGADLVRIGPPTRAVPRDVECFPVRRRRNAAVRAPATVVAHRSNVPRMMRFVVLSSRGSAAWAVWLARFSRRSRFHHLQTLIDRLLDDQRPAGMRLPAGEPFGGDHRNQRIRPAYVLERNAN